MIYKNLFQSDLYKNSVDKKITLYQDPKIKVFQYGSGYRPEYFLWYESLETHKTYKIYISGQMSILFRDFIYDFCYKTFTPLISESIRFIPNVDFEYGEQDLETFSHKPNL